MSITRVQRSGKSTAYSQSYGAGDVITVSVRCNGMTQLTFWIYVRLFAHGMEQAVYRYFSNRIYNIYTYIDISEAAIQAWHTRVHTMLYTGARGRQARAVIFSQKWYGIIPIKK